MYNINLALRFISRLPCKSQLLGQIMTSYKCVYSIRTDAIMSSLDGSYLLNAFCSHKCLEICEKYLLLGLFDKSSPFHFTFANFPWSLVLRRQVYDTRNCQCSHQYSMFSIAIYVFINILSSFLLKQLHGSKWCIFDSKFTFLVIYIKTCKPSKLSIA